jgi:alpha-1,3-rhamnosyl/mannosyltransferase
MLTTTRTKPRAEARDESVADLGLATRWSVNASTRTETLTETIAFDARFVCDRYDGIGRHAFGLLEALSRLDARRRYVAYYHPAYANTRFDLGSLAERENVELRHFPLPLYQPAEQLAWPLILRRDRATLFHTPYVALPLLASLPTVLTVHDLIFERFPAFMPRRRLRAIYRALTWAGTWRGAAVLTPSRATERDLEACYPAAAGKIRMIGGAVDRHFRPDRDRLLEAEVRERHGLPERFLLTVGAGRPHKNVELLIEAYMLLGAAGAPPLVIAGSVDPRFTDGVGQRIEALGLESRVSRVGRVDEAHLPALYRLSEALVFPSLVEGFGLPVVEAMACGTPVIASSASSVPEAAGGAALLFDPFRPDDLAQRLRQFLADPSLRRELRARGLARAAQVTWDAVARATLAVYDELLAA